MHWCGDSEPAALRTHARCCVGCTAGLISRLRALEHLNMSSQYELQSRAPFDLSSLALLHGLAALSFVALV